VGDSTVAVLDVIKIIETELAATRLHPHDPSSRAIQPFKWFAGSKSFMRVLRVVKPSYCMPH
jgi:hypothetical protein